MSVPDSEGSQLLPEDLGPGKPVSGIWPYKKLVIKWPWLEMDQIMFRGKGKLKIATKFGDGPDSCAKLGDGPNKSTLGDGQDITEKLGDGTDMSVKLGEGKNMSAKLCNRSTLKDIPGRFRGFKNKILMKLNANKKNLIFLIQCISISESSNGQYVKISICNKSKL